MDPAAPAAAKSAGPQAPLPVHGVRDIEAGGGLQRSASRASLPGTPSPPGDTRGGAEEAEEEEFPWGPAHPCFPHTNPHVPLNSPLYESTRIIRIKRDWMQVGDIGPAFANLYPEVLDPLVSEEEFRKVVRHINAELIASFTPWSVRAWADSVLGAATLWLYDDLGLSAVRQRLRKLEDWIEDWNKRVGEREGVRIISLRRTAYMTLDFQIPDPHISVESSSGPAVPADAANPQPPVNPNMGDFGPFPAAAVIGQHNAQTHLPAGVSAH